MSYQSEDRISNQSCTAKTAQLVSTNRNCFFFSCNSFFFLLKKKKPHCLHLDSLLPQLQFFDPKYTLVASHLFCFVNFRLIQRKYSPVFELLTLSLTLFLYTPGTFKIIALMMFYFIFLWSYSNLLLSSTLLEVKEHFLYIFVVFTFYPST